MKRTVLAVILIICSGFAVYGQESSIDLILLLDTSQGMSSSYENINEYLTGSFLSEFLRVGDTFHFISFSDDQKLEIARRINGIGDVEAIIGRMLLQYPIETGSSIESVLSYAERYVTTLPARPKKIVLISLGSAYRDDSVPDAVETVNASRARLFNRDTTVDFVQVIPGQPLMYLPLSGRPALVRTAPSPAQSSQISPAQQTVQTTPAPVQTQTAPAQTQTTQPSAQTQVTQTPPAQTTQPSAQTQVTQTPPAQTTQPSAQTQITQTPPAQTQTTPTQTTQTQQTQPSTSAAQTTPSASARTTAQTSAQRQSESWFSSLPFVIALIILALLILGLIIFFASRRLGKNPSKAITSASSKTAQKDKTTDSSKDLEKYKSSQNRRTTPYDNVVDKNKPVEINPDGPLLLNLFVEDQNTAIGKRNIHSLKSGYSLSIGGGKRDDFLIFLVPMPSHIGEIKRNGSQLTFIPQKPKYFPDIGSNEVNDCINKTIRIISDKNYEMRFRFQMHEDPLIALNRMLNSLNVPG